MLTSLFGDLGGAIRARKPESDRREEDASDQGFAATAFMGNPPGDGGAHGAAADRHSQDLIAMGSPAQAIRDHFAATRADLDTAGQLITLLDPSKVWAAAVIKALSDAGGQPIERLHLREAITLRSLATIERTALVRRQDDTLKVVRVDVRASGPENEEIPLALMERSHLTAVIVGVLEPRAIEALLHSMLEVSYLPTWRCPQLLFMLPPNGAWIATKIASLPWPDKVKVHHRTDPLVSASSVWNTVLAHWVQIRLASARQLAQDGGVPAPGPGDFPIKVADFQAARQPAHAEVDHHSDDSDLLLTRQTRPMTYITAPVRQAVAPVFDPSSAPPTAAPDPGKTHKALTVLSSMSGLLACAVIDSASGLVVSRHHDDDASGNAIDLDVTAGTAARLVRAQRQAAVAVGLPGTIREMTTRAGSRQLVMRPLAGHPRLFLLLLLDRQRTDMNAARRTLAEAEKSLA